MSSDWLFCVPRLSRDWLGYVLALPSYTYQLYTCNSVPRVDIVQFVWNFEYVDDVDDSIDDVDDLGNADLRYGKLPNIGNNDQGYQGMD